MKNLVVIFTCVLLLSCSTQKITLSPFVTAYKGDGNGNILPVYIILRSQPKFFEIYSPGIYESTIGQWSFSNDTLLLLPKYNYYERNNEMYMNRINPEDSTILSIPQQYLLKKDSLFNVTDYSTILPELFYIQGDNNEVYIRCK